MKAWTVAELIEVLKALPQDAKVLLEDADTMWTVPKFEVTLNEHGVWIIPCEYNEMASTYP